MVSLKTNYTGIELKNPLVVAACSLSGKIENIKKIEDAGAGALVIKSLFEEQICREMDDLDAMLSQGAESFPEAITYFPKLEHSGPSEHLMWIEKTRAAVKIPLFASLNAVRPGKWVEYAKRMEAVGVNGLELNVYAVEADISADGRDVEKRIEDTVARVVSSTTLPVTVKLSPFFSAPANMIARIQQAGAHGVVLFNRFLQPDIDSAKEQAVQKMTWSYPGELLLPLRWIALMYGRVNIDLIGNTGIASGDDMVRMLLAGASAVQCAGAFYRNGIGHIETMLNELTGWMEQKGYSSLTDFRGKCCQNNAQPFLFERAQYIDCLMKQKD